MTYKHTIIEELNNIRRAAYRGREHCYDESKDHISLDLFQHIMDLVEHIEDYVDE